MRDKPDGRRLADRQRAFAAAVLHSSLPVPAGVVDPDGRGCPKRFGVYRNNVLAGMIEALQESFPAVRRLVGEEHFSAMARLYATARPPRSPVMLEYGATFPAFIAGFQPVASLPEALSKIGPVLLTGSSPSQRKRLSRQWAKKVWRGMVGERVDVARDCRAPHR